jgi:hypothetical protein
MLRAEAEENDPSLPEADVGEGDLSAELVLAQQPA